MDTTLVLLAAEGGTGCEVTTWAGAIGGIISPLVALLIGWLLARRDALKEARIRLFAQLSEHAQTLRTDYQRLEDEIRNNPEFNEERKNNYLNDIAHSATRLKVDRLMSGILFGGEPARAVVAAVCVMIQASTAQGNLQVIDASVEELYRHMKILGERYVGTK